MALPWGRRDGCAVLCARLAVRTQFECKRQRREAGLCVWQTNRFQRKQAIKIAHVYTDRSRRRRRSHRRSRRCWPLLLLLF